jgi:hypothetical protein
VTVAVTRQKCPECYVAFGRRCVPCPDGSPLPECRRCIDQERPRAPTFFERSPVLGPVLLSAIVAVGTSTLVGLLQSAKK